MNDTDSDTAGADAKPKPSVFVHDFIPLDVEFDTASSALLSLLGTGQVAFSVAGACNREGAVGVDGVAGRTLHPHEVVVTVGQVRWREDAVVIPITWRPDPADAGVPLEADLEVASYGARRCHLHLLGRARLRPGMQPSTREASLYGRLAVAVVRHVLDDLAVAVATRVDGHLLSPSASALGTGR